MECLFDGFYFSDLREELLDGSLYPPVQSAWQQWAAQARSTQADGYNAAFIGNEFYRSTVKVFDIGAELINEGFESRFGICCRLVGDGIVSHF